MQAFVFLQTACSMSLGLGEDSINASAVLVMPMVSSKINGFRGNRLDRAKLFNVKNSGSDWSGISIDEEGAKLLETSAGLPPSP